MSLANLFVQGGRAVLQADAASTSAETGKVGRLGPKLHPVGRLPAAVTCRGWIEVAVMVDELRLGAFATVADMLAGLPNVLRAIGERMTADGWSETSTALHGVAWVHDRPKGFVIVTDRTWFDGQVEPYRVVMLRSTVGSVRPVSDMMGRPVDFENPTSFDIEQDSLQLIEAQRATPWADFPAGSDPKAISAHRIGGWVDQVEVSAKGLLWRRLVEWPEDRVGERIAA